MARSIAAGVQPSEQNAQMERTVRVAGSQAYKPYQAPLTATNHGDVGEPIHKPM
jgi:hypothetical protein